MKRAVAFRAAEHVQDFLPMSKRDILLFEGCEEAWAQALAQGRHRTLDDLSFVETHDCFTIAELIEYEAMGLARAGRARGSRSRADGEGRRCRSIRRAGSRPRATRSAPPACRCTR
jgi:acetyl-CoA C-acetyltransferase